MNIELKLNYSDDKSQIVVPVSNVGNSSAIAATVEPKAVVSLDTAPQSKVLNLTSLSIDSTNVGSNFEVCPDASIPSDLATNPNAHIKKINALVKYAKTYPTESQPIQNLVMYANNLSNASLLSADAKKSLIRNIQTATMNSTDRASSKGFQGLKGQSASTKFLADVLAPFKSVSGKITKAEVAHQTLRALSGQLILKGSDATHPSLSDMHAQNCNLLQSIGMPSNPNGLGSKSKAPASAPVNNVSDAPPPLGSSLPGPVLPPSGAPVPPNVFPESGSTVGLKGIKDYYSGLLEYIHAHPGDITAQQYMMEFLVKISNFYSGNIPADITSILDPTPSNGAGALDAIKSFLPRLAQYSFFTGYGSEGNNGKAGLSQYLAAMQKALSSGSGSESPYMQAMSSQIQKFNNPGWITNYANNHTDASGNLFYKVTMPGTPAIVITYNWSDSIADPADGMGSKAYILEVLNNQGPNQDPHKTEAADPFNVALDSQINNIQESYRVSALQDLLAKYKDPLTAITLWVMQVFDNQYQTQEGGLNETTDDLTNMTNDIATRLSTLAQDIGFTGYVPGNVSNAGMPTGQKMTAAQAQSFLQTLANGSTSMDSMYQLNGVQSSWDNNVFKDICGIPLTNPTNPATNKPAYGTKDFGPAGHFPATVGELLYGKNADGTDLYTDDQKATFLCTLNLGPPPAPTGTVLPSQPIPPSTQGFQQITGDFQQAGSLITGKSKIESMQLQQVSDCDSQDIKAWSTMLQDLAQFILKGPISGQKTS